ncbi:hypothetical protein BGW37DRAFT_556923 [Umbelopsis sp. PMI_123]|nr:hypothetical protein BGW37DRAFT_556923 [Umbelopsis sp. PMI_123]
MALLGVLGIVGELYATVVALCLLKSRAQSQLKTPSPSQNISSWTVAPYKVKYHQRVAGAVQGWIQSLKPKKEEVYNMEEQAALIAQRPCIDGDDYTDESTNKETHVVSYKYDYKGT